MNIKRIIDKNQKLIWYVALIIAFAFFAIKSLNSYYEKDEIRKKNELTEKANAQEEVITESDYTVKSDSIELTMSSFVNYCNKRNLESAYKMLTDECKEAMFPTVDDFEKVYINNVYSVEREYELLKWSTDGNLYTYLVTLYGDILATGGTAGSTQEYYTFVKESDGNYKLNVNNYIFGEDRDIESTVSNITIKIGHVDIYEEYEEAQITITNNTSKTISLTGNKYNKNMYLQNSKNTTYSSFGSEFDEEIVMKPNSVRNFTVKFNKTYSSSNKAQYLVLSDVILDYEGYLQSEDKINYSNRTSIQIEYQK